MNTINAQNTCTKQHIEWFEIECEGLERWQRTFGRADSGEFYFPFYFTGIDDETKAIVLSVNLGGSPILHMHRYFLPESVICTANPSGKEICRKVASRISDFRN